MDRENVLAACAYFVARYGRKLTDDEIREIIERETGGSTVPDSEYDVLPGGFEILKPTWNTTDLSSRPENGERPRPGA